ncbi:MAG: large-conductance mechanosensitive channel protein MscL [Bacteroidetes bacterium]|jgi:large conductance mechanosensitive channel|nr:MAG: large-conductance mechanosensitive channel protein MscL [Bacteroidota bacterium]
MLKEFKAFIVQGNVLDLAIGVIIGAAFGKIVSALVDKVLMPPIGYLLGGVNFSDLKIVLAAATAEVKDAAGAIAVAAKPEVAIGYGAFLQAIIDFLIVAFVIFMVVKAYNSTKKKEVEAPAAPAGPSEEVKLLTEIRDALKK